MTSKKVLKAVALQLPTKKRYKKNLDRIVELLDTYSHRDIVVIPEVYLTGYDYDNISTASKFSASAIKLLKKIVDSQIVVLTIIKNSGDGFVNQAIVIHKHKVVHRQNKAKLFKLGDEHKYLQAGDTKDILPFEIDGVSYAILICFELRFKDLWRQIEGVDVVIISARWGIERKRHLEILSQALAVMNQAFVILSNSSDSDMASSSSIISPNGDTTIDDSRSSIEGVLNLKEVRKMRRYIVLK